jgi:hypothetical protein
LQRLADAGAGQGGADRGQHRGQLLDVVGLWVSSAATTICSMVAAA